jgi:trimeric autotransporter adhesin
VLLITVCAASAATAATTQQTLPYSLKTGDSEDQAVLTRITSILAGRIRDSVKLNTKFIEAAATSTRLPTSASPAAVAAVTAAAVLAEREVQRATELANWLCSVLLDGLYPGAPFAREVLVAQLLGVLSAALAPPHPLSAVVAAALTAPSATVALLNLLISSWDRSRQLAAALLARFPPPLALQPTPSNSSNSSSSSNSKSSSSSSSCSDSTVPTTNGTTSYNSSGDSSSDSSTANKGVGSGLRLVRWGLLMTRSPRQRESDAGALILRLVLRSHAAGTGWCVPLAAVDAAAEGAYSVDTHSTSGSSALCFAASTTASVNGCDQRPVRRSSTEVQGEFGTAGPLGTGALSFVRGLCDVLAGRLQGVAAAYAALANGDDVAAELAAAKSSLSALHLGTTTPRTATAASTTAAAASGNTAAASTAASATAASTTAAASSSGDAAVDTAQGLSLAHGVLAALHYAVAEVPWAHAVASPFAADWRRVAVNILTGVQVCCVLLLPLL